MRERCINRLDNLKKAASEYPEADLVIGQNWLNTKNLKSKQDDNITLEPEESEEQINNYLKSLSEIVGDDSKGYILGSTQGSSYNVFQCQAKSSLPLLAKLNENDCEKWQKSSDIKINNVIKQLSSQYNNLVYIDPNETLCAKDKCRIITDENKPVYSDNRHFSKDGADVVGKFILDKMK
ncbi:hypothetical protein C9I99_24255 [Photobacterium lutimaris]|uniref:SGNH domain-containing protein n=1 Tax=Photobacterium lutimaris TaxID=388278 RepID=A0A2T3IND5_9GAMM|nr:hypothetical protein C9I99_24255 [Photobacterium lutimaris]TDR75274.1 hypothetical protein DFP78_105297 [Photobacterium lutimaris]